MVKHMSEHTSNITKIDLCINNKEAELENVKTSNKHIGKWFKNSHPRILIEACKKTAKGLTVSFNPRKGTAFHDDTISVSQPLKPKKSHKSIRTEIQELRDRVRKHDIRIKEHDIQIKELRNRVQKHDIQIKELCAEVKELCAEVRKRDAQIKEYHAFNAIN